MFLFAFFTALSHGRKISNRITTESPTQGESMSKHFVTHFLELTSNYKSQTISSNLNNYFYKNFFLPLSIIILNARQALLVFHKSDNICEVVTEACHRQQLDVTVARTKEGALETLSSTSEEFYHLIIIDARSTKHLDAEYIAR